MTGRLYGILLIIALAVSLVVPLAGCGGQKEKGTQAENTYTVADATGDWGFPSPYAHYFRGPGYIRMSLIFDTLLWKNEKEYIPALAKSWEYNAGENSYTFSLVENATWHDGSKFTARDVVFTIDYTKMHPYQGVSAGVVKKAEALGDYRVKMYLDRPYAPFLEYIGGTLPILPEHIWKDVGSPEKFQQEKALVGTGPFILEDYSKEQGSYLYRANREYYQGKPAVDRIRFVKMGSQVMAAALRQKQASAAQVPPELGGALDEEGFFILAGKHDWVAKLMINHQREPLNKKEFRQALAFAIDRQALVGTCLRGHGLPGSPGLIPPDSPWYNAAVENQYPHSPERAALLIKGLGYEKKGNFFEKNGRALELELLVSGGGQGSPGAPGDREGEMIKGQLEKVGLKVSLRSLESKTLDSRVAEGQYDIALGGHGGLGGDPEMLNRMILDKGFNSARYQDSQELNLALKQQLTLMDRESRRELVGKVQEIYAREMPALPLYYPTWYWAHDGRAPLYYTLQGVGSGVPIPLNKMAFVNQND
ncbi:MAG: ABC transporter substrate-binding protein [Peptococcaceae bacterium BICA1-7]|nr:MAG: ABC transporter substrate-binding protein [Peptococcaceae bacterium BICA1-7]